MKDTVGFAYNTLRPVPFDRVTAAFRYGDPNFNEVLFTSVFKHVQRYILAGKAPASSVCTREQVIFL